VKDSRCYSPNSSAPTTPISVQLVRANTLPQGCRRAAVDSTNDRKDRLDHGLDRKRVFVTGLSAGGAMTSVMLATYPEKFAGGAIIAGLP
jgi:dienelactone hydrolase